MRILERAVDTRADSVHLEYECDGLEVTYMFAHTGIGELIGDRALASQVMACVVEKAKLRRRERGSMLVTLLGKEYTVSARQYENFGESAFELRLGKPKP